MYYESIDSLNLEVITVQLYDEYFKNGYLMFDSVFLNQQQKNQNQELAKIYKYIEKQNKHCQTTTDQEYFYMTDFINFLDEDVYIYSNIYNIPKYDVNYSTKLKFFNTIAEYYLSNNDGDFCDDMETLNNLVIARSLVYNLKSVTIDDYIASLKYCPLLTSLSSTDIVKIVDKLSISFNTNGLALIANNDGSYGKVVDIDFLFDPTDNVMLLDGEIKQLLITKGYKVATSSEQLNNNDKNDYKKTKVINFKDYLNRRK